MPGDDYRWSWTFCQGCQQLTWHYDGLCTNVDYHRSPTAFCVLPGYEPAPPPPPDLAPAEAAEKDEDEDEEATP